MLVVTCVIRCLVFAMCWLLAVVCWLSFMGLVLFVRRLLLRGVGCCLLLVVFPLLAFDVCCVLYVVCCSVIVVCCCCVYVVVCRLLLVACHVLACCLLLVS